MDIVVDKSASYESLRDRVVVITGGGQGIGRGFAHHFAAQGAVPVVADINGANAARRPGGDRDPRAAARSASRPTWPTRPPPGRWPGRRFPRSGGSTC